MSCGCRISYYLTSYGDSGYGGETVEVYEIDEAEIVAPCYRHGGGAA